MSWFYRVLHNPLVMRAFRVGFRPGPTSFRIAPWSLALILIVFGILITAYYARDLGTVWVGEMLAVFLTFYTAATFVVGGIQRMLVSFSQERERGTFEFIHLSTMSPRSIVLGFLLAGQLPGYLLLGLTLPILFIGAFLADYQLVPLLGMVGMLAFYVLVLSLFFLFLGFWMKKAADLRGASLFFAVLFCVITSLMYYNFFGSGAAGAPVGVLAGFPVIRSMWDRATVDGGGMYAQVFGAQLPLELLALVFLTPLMFVFYSSLVRCLRHRERKPFADGVAWFLLLWFQLFLVATLWGVPVAQDRSWFICVLVMMIFNSRVLAAAIRPRHQVIRLLARLKGNVSQALWHAHGPPIRLALGLALGMLGIGFLLRMDPNQAGSPLWLIGVPFLPLLLTFSMGQQLELYRGGRQRGVITGVFGLFFVWLPLIVYAFITSGAEVLPRTLGQTGFDALYCYGLLSPLSQVLYGTGVNGFEDGVQPISGHSVSMIAGQVIFCAVVVWFNYLSFAYLRKSARYYQPEQPA